MTGPKCFEWAIILVSTATIVGSLISGTLGLVFGPPEYGVATRESDPGRYWAFIIGAAIVTLALTADVLLR